jgi:hypothetical protein
MQMPVTVPTDLNSLLTVMNSAGILTIVFFAGKLTNRVDNLERTDRDRTMQASEIAVIRTQVGAALEDLKSVKIDVHELRRDWDEFRGTVLNKKLTGGHD